MTVSAQDLLASLKTVHGIASCEADWRGVCARAYYTIYDDCKNFHVSLPTPGRVTPDSEGGKHADLIDQLSNPMVKAGSDEFLKSMSIGMMMKTVYVARIKSDYKRKETVQRSTAATSVELAAKILEKLQPPAGGRPALTRIK